MPGALANVIPVNAKLSFDPENSTFRLRVNTQVKRPDGTRYEVEVDVNADLGALLTVLVNLWTHSGMTNTYVTAMQQPSPVTMPPALGDYNGLVGVGVFGDVGTADMADDILDTTGLRRGP